MRVIIPYAGAIHPITERAIGELSATERFDVGGDDHAYSRLFASLWHEGETFLIVEHDIEPNREAFEDITRCGGPWCLSAYELAIGVGRAALGFAQFSADLMARFPDLIDRALRGEFTPKGYDPRHWTNLDFTVYSALTAEGVHWHHHPVVRHHHWHAEVGRCTCGSPREEICPTRRHHLGDLGCDLLAELTALADQPGAPPAVAKMLNEEQQRSAAANIAANERAQEEERQRLFRRARELERLPPLVAERERNLDAAYRARLYPGPYAGNGMVRDQRGSTPSRPRRPPEPTGTHPRQR